MAPCPLLFFVSSVLMALLSSAAANGQGGERCSPVRCGNVRCANNTPYLGYARREHWFQILDIFYDNAPLLVADVHKLEGFSSAGGSKWLPVCHIPTNNTPGNPNLIFYNCTTKAPDPAPVVVAGDGLVETKCRNNTFVRVGGRYDGESSSYGSYYLEGCDAAVVPVLGRPDGGTNASSYEELISAAFLTWQLPQGSLSAASQQLSLIPVKSSMTWLIGSKSISMPLIFKNKLEKNIF
ncbi:hypothetical protein BS78_03G072100 [Paspalum vaginatum]|nr:hypothetical protein BS78_03G072100 [Paspalum vaginatum]